MYDFLKTILTMSVLGSAAALIIFAFKPLTKRVFGIGWQYYIWLTALLIMITPVSFRIPQAKDIENNIGVRVIKVYGDYEKKAVGIMPEGSERADIVKIIFLTYVIAMLITAAFRLSRYFIFKRSLYKNSVPCDLGELVPKRLSVRKTSAAGAPFLIGLLRPVLFLPDADLNDDAFKYALMHELVHYRRRDILYKWVVMLVKTLHWFNPVVYWISVRINEDCEISCDMAATKGMNDREKKEYMRAVLSFASASSGRKTALTTGLSGSGKTIKKRFSFVAKGRYASRVSAAFSWFFAVLFFSVGVLASGTANGKLVPPKNAVSIVSQPTQVTNIEEAEQKSGETRETDYEPYYEPEAEAADAEGQPPYFPPEESPIDPQEALPDYSAEVTRPEEAPSIEPEENINREDTVRPPEEISYQKTGSYSYKENGRACAQRVKSDENGNINIFFKSDTPGHTVHTVILESETEKLVTGFIGVVNNENIYDFPDLDPEKEYDIYFDTETGQDWLIEDEYFIY